MIRRPSPARSQSARPKPAAVSTPESVEPRVLLSGNVDASFDEDGVLILQADQASNDLRVEIEVDGTVTFSSESTTVNDAGAATVTLNAPAGGITGIRAILGGGRDELDIVGGQSVDGAFRRTPIDGDIIIRGGGGSDVLSLTGLDSTGLIRHVGGPGQDVLSLSNSEALDIKVEGGRGDDTLMLDGVTGRASLRVYGGRQVDTIAARDVFVDSVEDVPRLYGGFNPDAVAVETNVPGLVARGNAGPGLAIAADGLNDDGTEDPAERAVLDAVFAAAGEAAGEDVFETPRLGLEAGSDEFNELFPDFAVEQFTRAESGILFRVVDEGTGEPVTGNDEVELNYQLYLSDGTAVAGNDTYASGNTFTTRDGNGDGQLDVIDGFGEALGLVGEGGAVQVLIPPHLGYGASGSGPNIPGDATLLFNIEVLNIMRGETEMPETDGTDGAAGDGSGTTAGGTAGDGSDIGDAGDGSDGGADGGSAAGTSLAGSDAGDDTGAPPIPDAETDSTLGGDPFAV